MDDKKVWKKKNRKRGGVQVRMETRDKIVLLTL